ncbi:MAG: hypothetical protein Q9174_006783 [Haloplaca sp. 1 TL-2023]
MAASKRKAEAEEETDDLMEAATMHETEAVKETELVKETECVNETEAVTGTNAIMEAAEAEEHHRYLSKERYQQPVTLLKIGSSKEDIESYQKQLTGLYDLVGNNIDWLDDHRRPMQAGKQLPLGLVEKAQDSFFKVNAKLMDWYGAGEQCIENIEQHGYRKEYLLQRRSHDDSLTVQQRQEFEAELGKITPPPGIEKDMDLYISWLDLGSTTEDFESLAKSCRNMECLLRSRSQRLQLAAKRHVWDKDPEGVLELYNQLFLVESEVYRVGSIFEGLVLAVDQEKGDVERTKVRMKEFREKCQRRAQEGST